MKREIKKIKGRSGIVYEVINTDKEVIIGMRKGNVRYSLGIEKDYKEMFLRRLRSLFHCR